MTDLPELFPKTYETSRERFRSQLPTVQAMWPDARLVQHALPGEENLTVDWIISDALETNEKLLLLTTGEHGIEGYVGSAMMQRFIESYMPKLDPRKTGILLVHAINPWGMKHHRRGNRDNIDLNRTFIWDKNFDPAFNMEYDRINAFLNPPGKVNNVFIDNIKYLLGLGCYVTIMGTQNFRYALLLGQYRHPKGLFYGGKELPDETATLMELYRQALSSYDQVVQLDMHTGYGPRYQMSLVNSALDKGTSGYFSQRFNYPLVVAATANEFYALRGDMIDYIYALRQNEFPQKKLYATSFEFGTLGNFYYGLFQSPRVMVHENRAFFYGSANENVDAQAKHGFEELFYPSAKDWRQKAVDDADQAFTGILKAEGYIP